MLNKTIEGQQLVSKLENAEELNSKELKSLNKLLVVDLIDICG